MSNQQRAPARLRWARLRFSIIGPLLAAPPERGELRRRLEELAQQSWRHPTTGECVRFSLPTLERWLYQARNATDDPVAALERQIPGHAGIRRSVGEPLRQAIHLQYRQHPYWSYRLHHDNLLALAERDSSLSPVPSQGTVCRYMKEPGLLKQRRRKRRAGEDPVVAPREMRSFEVRHVHGLWHADHHFGSRRVLSPTGEWQTPLLLGFLDDRSRLACHLQWYLGENTETFVHGLTQAILKRGLPRSLLTDNGNPRTAAETRQGLERLGITHWTTLPYTPEQNPQQAKFWGQVEGRLLAMLEGQRELTLPLLNQATQAWVELEYNRRCHSELGPSPLERFLAGPHLGRPSPSSEALRRVFRMEVRRQQRRSDGTITVEGKRFELPSRYRALSRPAIRYARWDLSTVDLVDPRRGKHRCTLLPLDKEKNADGRRSTLQPVISQLEPRPAAGIAPRLQQLMGLRSRWSDHIASTLTRPVLSINESQEMLSSVFSELRLFSSKEFDSRSLLCVVFAGDNRLPDRFRHQELLPLGSRIPRRLTLDYPSRDELLACLDHLLQSAGNSALLTTELKTALAEHSAGNQRVMMNLGDELLAHGLERELAQLDEKLFFEVFAPPEPKKKTGSGRRR